MPKKPAGSRMTYGEGGLTQKIGRYTKADGQVEEYIYWQASREVAPEHLPPGMARKRITGSARKPLEARKRMAENYKRFLDDNPTPRTRSRNKKKITVRELFELWEAKDCGGVSDTMIYKYVGYLNNHVLPTLGDKRLDRLTDDDFAMLFDEILPSKRRPDGKRLLGSAARRNIYMALSAMFRWGVKQRHLEENPLKRQAPPRREIRHVDIDNLEEQARDLMGILTDPSHPEYCRWMLQFLGLRRSERLGLKWDDIKGLDTDSPRMWVRRHLVRVPSRVKGEPATYEVAWGTKGDSQRKENKEIPPRIITIPEPFRSSLRRYRDYQDQLKRRPEWQPKEEFKDLVFLQDDGSLITLNRDNEDWHKILEEHGFTYWRGHLNRHITASWLAAQNPPVPVVTAQQILGHATKAMTWYYTHVIVAQQQEPLERFGRSITPQPTKRGRDRKPRPVSSRTKPGRRPASRG